MFIEVLAQAIARRIEIHLAQNEIREKTEEASRLRKEDSLVRLAGGVAHEINNPLTLVNSYSEILIKKAERDELPKDKVIEYSNKIQKGVTRITDIIKALQSFSKDIKSEQADAYLVSEIIETVKSLAKERLEESGIDFDDHQLDPNLTVLCRRSHVAEALYFIILNSMDALREQENPKITISASETAKRVKIVVSDNGTGVDEDFKKKLFEPFATTKEIGSGKGLGLSAAKGLIEMNNGTISLQKADSPTEFVVELKAA
jgi:C4-dicarboxylate-specific signal transduction histidine kinase